MSKMAARWDTATDEQHILIRTQVRDADCNPHGGTLTGPQVASIKTVFIKSRLRGPPLAYSKGHIRYLFIISTKELNPKGALPSQVPMRWLLSMPTSSALHWCAICVVSIDWHCKCALKVRSHGPLPHNGHKDKVT